MNMPGAASSPPLVKSASHSAVLALVLCCACDHSEAPTACGAGEVRVTGECRRLCTPYGNCDPGQYCDATGICAPLQDPVLPPQIDEIAAAACVTPGRTVSAQPDPGPPSCFALRGSRLDGAKVLLTAADDVRGPREMALSALTLSAGPQDQQLEIRLPPGLPAGRYVLAVTDGAGADDRALVVLQGPAGAQGAAGEKGDVGDPGPPGPPGPIAALLLTDEYEISQSDRAGVNTQRMVAVDSHFCFLTSVGIEQVDQPGASAHCHVRRGANDWHLEAELKADADSDVWCKARCVRGSDR